MHVRADARRACLCVNARARGLGDFVIQRDPLFLWVLALVQTCVVQKDRAGFVTHKHNPSKNSGFGAYIRSRVTTVVHVRMTIK